MNKQINTPNMGWAEEGQLDPPLSFPLLSLFIFLIFQNSMFNKKPSVHWPLETDGDNYLWDMILSAGNDIF